MARLKKKVVTAEEIWLTISEEACDGDQNSQERAKQYDQSKVLLCLPLLAFAHPAGDNGAAASCCHCPQAYHDINDRADDVDG